MSFFKILIFGLIGFIVFSVGAVKANEDPATGSVTIATLLQDPFIDLDLDTPDHLQESDKLPTPNQVVFITAQIDFIDNTSSEMTVILFYDAGTNLQDFLNLTMVYNIPTDSYRTFLGPYPAGTIINYYATSYDGFYTIRTPTTGYSQLIWDVEATVASDGGAVQILNVHEDYDILREIDEEVEENQVTIIVVIVMLVPISVILRSLYDINFRNRMFKRLGFKWVKYRDFSLLY